jgi:PAS domain-containing protein
MDSVSLDDPRLALAVVEAQVGSLVEILPVAVLITDRHGHVLRANAAAAELLEQASLVGRCIDSVVPKQDQVEVRQRWLVHGDDVLRLFVVHPR